MTIETTKVITDDGAALHVETRGRGEPLLLLHGLTGSGDDWMHVFDRDALATSHRVVAPDARGHGRSTSVPGSFTFRRCARDVLAILDQLGIARTRAIGLSLGAKTLLHVATLAPERIDAMVLVSATPRMPEAAHAAIREALLRHGAPEVEDPDDLRFGPERLSQITARTLIVAGDRDPLYPVELAVEIFRGIPDAALAVVPFGGHGPIFGGEREPFVRSALSFLDRGADQGA